jgi:3D (Asp-Asp-Asp) domain-containing protein
MVYRKFAAFALLVVLVLSGVPTPTDVIPQLSPSDTMQINRSELKREPTYLIEVSYYCPCEKCCGKSNGITASGTKATEGRTIAADTSIFPMGTKILLNGKVLTVEDTGSYIKGNRIDVYLNSHDECLKMGRHKEIVTIVR